MFLSHVSLTVIDTDKVLTGESCKSSVTQRPAAVLKTPYTVRTMNQIVVSQGIIVKWQLLTDCFIKTMLVRLTAQ